MNNIQFWEELREMDIYVLCCEPRELITIFRNVIRQYLLHENILMIYFGDPHV